MQLPVKLIQTRPQYPNTATLLTSKLLWPLFTFPLLSFHVTVSHCLSLLPLL